MKKLLFIIFVFISTNNIAYADLNTLECQNILSKSKTNIVYGQNFAKEEMSPNIWLFFQKIILDKEKLNIISVDDEKPIREWKINLVSGEAILIPMFDPSSKWLCKI
ncbi:hypothetical protein [Candidatus Pelagibacter communis]|uniref:hypothetical protein n=1 Tax=Pelagibacter ubique TaxID=198252 RepID=UPI00094DA01D|nr:hypothetical protein [Candidatus Pelagibacter ubique]